MYTRLSMLLQRAATKLTFVIQKTGTRVPPMRKPHLLR